MTPTPEIVKVAYAYLNETPPFVEWNLPSEDDMKFEVLHGPDVHGRIYPSYGSGYVLGVAEHKHEHTASLMVTVAHEMVHLHLHQIKFRGWKNHGPTFRALAAEVCSAHGFDPGQF